MVPSETSLILPVHRLTDEVENFLRTLLEVPGRHFDILLLDNGSTDSLANHLSDFDLENRRVSIHRVEQNLGFGGAVVAGAKVVASSNVAWAPTNGKVLPQDLVGFVNRAITSRAPVLKAKRKRSSKWLAFKAWIAGLAHSWLLGVNMFDSGGTPTVAEREILLGVTRWPTGPEFDAAIAYHVGVRRIAMLRFPVRYLDGPRSKSSWRAGRWSEFLLFSVICRFRKNSDLR